MCPPGFVKSLSLHTWRARTHLPCSWQEQMPQFFVIQITFLFSHLFIFLGIQTASREACWG